MLGKGPCAPCEPFAVLPACVQRGDSHRLNSRLLPSMRGPLLADL